MARSLVAPDSYDGYVDLRCDNDSPTRIAASQSYEVDLDDDSSDDADTVPPVPAPAAPWRNAKEGVCRLHVEFSASRSHGNVSSASSGSDQSRQRAMLPGRNASRESRSRSRSPPRASSEITILKDEMRNLQALVTHWRMKQDLPVKTLEKMIKNEQ